MLEIKELSVAVVESRVGGRGSDGDVGEILSKVSISVKPGEVQALMGPNGAGKSTLSNALMGRPRYEITNGQVLLDGNDITKAEPFERAQAGLFLGMQYPVEVPGVSLQEVLVASGVAEADAESAIESESKAVGQPADLESRDLNVDLSGGEKKRSETIQLGILKPKYAILDEPDSGLDIDSLNMVAERVKKMTEEDGLGVLVVTHYNRLLSVLKPDGVHVLAGGKIAKSGGPELAEQLEETGYAEFA